MLVAGLTADVFATNCYVLASDRNGPCVVVDPGAGVVERLQELLTEHELRPAAVLLTHGHFDHTYSAADLGEDWGIPVYISAEDREQLADPMAGVSADLRTVVGEDFIFTEPRTVLTYPDDGVLRVAGLEFTIDHAPGHTRGSVLIRGEDPDGTLCLSGDVLFAGSVGRTDLPGGDPLAMLATLRDRIGALADRTVVLPGHGPRTTIGRERAGNPYLRQALAGRAGAEG